MRLLETSPLFASVRTALSEDRVVRSALRQARDITQCRIVLLHAGFGDVQLCIALHGCDSDERIRRAMIRGVDLRVSGLQAHPDVDRFPRDAPRDLFDPLAIRAYAAAPLRVGDGIEGALQCLDDRPRAFTQEQLHDMEALSFTVCGRLLPRDFVGDVPAERLADRLRSLKRRLEPIDAMVLSQPQLTAPWRELGDAIEAAATELETQPG